MKTIDMENVPHPMDAKGGHVRRGRHARGGGTKVQEYNAQGSREAEEADDEKDEFSHGGKTRKKRAVGGVTLKDGGHAMGHEPHHRPDRASRSKRAAGGALALKEGGRAGHHHEHEHEHDAEHEHHHYGEGDMHIHHKRGGRTEHEEREEREHERRGGREHEREHHARGGRTGSDHTPFSSGHQGMGRDNKDGAAARGYEGVPVGDAQD